MNNGRMHVLVIEDNLEYARLVKEVLNRTKDTFTADCADTLAAGLGYLSKGNIDAVLLDLTLPDSQGMETFTRVHEKAPRVPVVILTGMNDEQFALDAIRQGAQDYLVKGQGEIQILSKVIRYAIERNRLQETPAEPPTAVASADTEDLSGKMEKCGLLPWLNAATRLRASDLFLTIGEAPLLKIHGAFQNAADEKLTSRKMDAIIEAMLTEEQRAEFGKGKEVDVGLEIQGLSRFRVNVFRARGGASIAFRPISRDIPTLDGLGLPPVLHDLTKLKSGMILVTGPTGNGKSTTLAAFINEINHRDEKHIVTIEDPIEYVISHNKSLVHQREVEMHTKSFADGLRSALREAPDIILIGELRDLESISLAIRAAETGHLVLGTLHSSTAAQAITRIMDVFESGQKNQIQTQLAQSLQAVVTQRLLKRLDGKGMVLASEVLILTPAVRNVIRSGHLAQVKMYIEMGRKEGMHSMEQSVQELISKGVVSPETFSELGFGEKGIKAA